MAFHRAGQEPINVFRVEDAYLFKHYFDEDEVFASLRRYYDDFEYRFEVPQERFEHVRDVLAEHGYGLTVVEDLEPFVVVKRKYTDHPSILFEGSVLHRSVGNFNCFVMKDHDAVDRAIEAGATLGTEADVAFSL